MGLAVAQSSKMKLWWGRETVTPGKHPVLVRTWTRSGDDKVGAGGLDTVGERKAGG